MFSIACIARDRDAHIISTLGKLLAFLFVSCVVNFAHPLEPWSQLMIAGCIRVCYRDFHRMPHVKSAGDFICLP
jgi:hypothetical protein